MRIEFHKVFEHHVEQTLIQSSCTSLHQVLCSVSAKHLIAVADLKLVDFVSGFYFPFNSEENDFLKVK